MIPETARPRSTGRPARDLGDEYLFYDEKGDMVHVLNGTAREIYLMCDGTRSLGDLTREIVQTYVVDGEVAQRDVAEIVAQLVELGLLTTA